MATINADAVTGAVKRLRLALGDTQQQFAARTKLAISTVVRYELSRPPKGDALQQLKELAEKHGYDDIARVFSYAMGEYVTPEIHALHSALASLWWNRKQLNDWPTLAEAMVTELKTLIEIKRERPDDLQESLADLETQLVQLRSVVSGVSQEKITAEASKILEENHGWTWEKATSEALTRNPALYEEYLAERARAAEGTQFESSLSRGGKKRGTK
jgi:transcriptional regulator with XRE-family HTH domain